MELWSTATLPTVGPWWGSAIIGLIGALVGAAATLLGGVMTERRKARHADALQWDKEIVKLAEALLTSVDRVVRSRPSPLAEVQPDQSSAFQRLCDEEEAKQTAVLGQLELIAPPAVKVAGQNLQNACLDLVHERYDLTETGPVRRHTNHAMFRDLRASFVSEVRGAIRR